MSAIATEYKGGASLYEAPLDKRRQAKFLTQALGKTANQIPEGLYGDIFLLLPYILKDKLENDDPPMVSIQGSLDRQLRRTYLFLYGLPAADVGELENITQNAVSASKKELADKLGQVVTATELVEIAEAVNRETLALAVGR